MSDEQKTVTLYDIQRACPAIGADSSNPHFKSRYATYEHIMKRLRPIIEQYSLCIEHVPRYDRVATRVSWPDGSTEWAEFPLPANEANPQKTGSALSYARRYNLCSLLNIVVVGDDDDGNEAQSDSQDGVQSQGQRGAMLESLKKGISAKRATMDIVTVTANARDWWKKQRDNMTSDEYMEGLAVLDELENAK